MDKRIITISREFGSGGHSIGFPVNLLNQQRRIPQLRRYSKSTGIGLYLCKKLCNKMNMEITIQSDLGQGTTVILSFPQESYLQEAGL